MNNQVNYNKSQATINNQSNNQTNNQESISNNTVHTNNTFGCVPPRNYNNYGSDNTMLMFLLLTLLSPNIFMGDGCGSDNTILIILCLLMFMPQGEFCSADRGFRDIGRGFGCI